MESLRTKKKMKMEEKEQSKRYIGFNRLTLTWRPSHLWSTWTGDWNRFDIGIKWVNEAAGTKRTKMSFLFSRSVLSQYRSKKLEKGPNWKAFMSLASISELRLELESLHRLSFGSAQWPSWFHLRSVFLLLIFIHAWDLGATDKKRYELQCN